MMVTNMVSIITRCKNRKHHLRTSLPYSINQTWHPKQIIIVDYDSDDGLHEMLWEEFEPWMLNGIIKEVRVNNQPKFIPAHAQNVGIQHANGEWLLFMDADNLMKPHMVAHLMSRVQGQRKLFCRPYADYMHRDKAGQMMCRYADMMACRGFLEELTVGWGFEDGDIRDRLLLYGCDLLEYSSRLSDVIEHSEEDRTGFMVEKDRRKSQPFHNEIARKNKMWHGHKANVGREWGARGIHVTDKETNYARRDQEIQHLVAAQGWDAEASA